MTLHEHPQSARLRAARSIGATDIPRIKPSRQIGSPLISLLAVLIAIPVSVIFLGWTLCMVAIAAVTRPGFWLGVATIAVVTKAAGWW